MNSIFINLLPSVIFLTPMGVVITMTLWFRHQRKFRRNPLTCQMLRSPGESINQRIEQLNEDLDLNLMFSLVMPLYCYSAYLTSRCFSQKPLSPAIFSIFGLILFVFFALRLNKIIRQRHNELLGLDCERAVGQELNHLMLDGCRVFHDFIADSFNIDHIVIGENGVFAIETKGRAKSNNGQGKDNVKVVYDGQTLQFPTWREREPIDQAKRQAAWLSNWLTSAVGEKVSVQPVLALAGWFVERKKNDLMIYNGKNPKFISKMSTDCSLSPKMVQRIAHQIDQHCRDVSPLAYRKEK